ncbi:COG0526 Thiol-disulfide isomerase and thioredoxins [Vibrio sp. B1REV9]|nr:COG0526 Thiol-disulfide isomerase and thioredoxins [Vibrio sp. B1REV9]
MLNVLTLYSTEGCHLCEMALDLVKQTGLAEQTHVVDIAFDDVLFLVTASQFPF